MREFDAVVIGGGILGCFAARNLKRWNVSVALLERSEDVCTGITRANSAVVYAGYDNKPGSLKAKMTVQGNQNLDRLCRELEVPFSRCGSLLVTYDAQSLPKLRKKWEEGVRNGVPGLRLLTGQEAEAMEPMLKPGVVGALHAPTTGTVNPWLLGVAAYENAVDNGVVPMMSTAVTGIEKTGTGYLLKTHRETIACQAVVNCAGLFADQVQELLFPPKTRLHWDGAEYLVLDKLTPKPQRVIFHQTQSCGKGITAVPCSEGNLLISGVRKEIGTPFATTQEGLEDLRGAAIDLLPGLDLTQVIRSFGAVRPNPYRENGESLHDFCIENPGHGFYSLIGIKTPGLTCADELGMYVAKEAAEFLKARPNPNFNPHRHAIPKSNDSEIVCQCEGITRSEILEAIRRGASTADGVKRRVGSGMGPCQGSRCAFAIETILEGYRNGTL
ncbi:MAG: NAD(P)/FAD-dependent oxidoreductase [Faecousia sp.]